MTNEVQEDPKAALARRVLKNCPGIEVLIVGGRPFYTSDLAEGRLIAKAEAADRFLRIFDDDQSQVVMSGMRYLHLQHHGEHVLHVTAVHPVGHPVAKSLQRSVKRAAVKLFPKPAVPADLRAPDHTGVTAGPEI